MARLQTEAEAPNTVFPGIGAAESGAPGGASAGGAGAKNQLAPRPSRGPVIQKSDATTGPSDAESRGTEDAADRPGTDGAADADVALLENAVQAALASFEQSVGALEEELEAEERLLAALGATAPAPKPGSCRTAKLSSHRRHG